MGGIALILFIASLVYLSIVMGINDRMEQDLRQEKLLSERLLSEKLLEQKKRSALQTDFDNLETRYATISVELDESRAMLKKSKSMLDDRQRQIRKLQTVLPGRSALLRQKMQQDSIQFSDERERFAAKTVNLENDLIGTAAENERLRGEIARLIREKLYDVAVDTRKRNQRLTVKGSRTKCIDVSIETARDMEDLSLEIIDPTGNLLPLSKENLSTSINAANDPAKKNVRIIYIADRKLSGGIYHVLVRSGGRFMGSYRLSLE